MSHLHSSGHLHTWAENTCIDSLRSSTHWLHYPAVFTDSAQWVVADSAQWVYSCKYIDIAEAGSLNNIVKSQGGEGHLLNITVTSSEIVPVMDLV